MQIPILTHAEYDTKKRCQKKKKKTTSTLLLFPHNFFSPVFCRQHEKFILSILFLYNLQPLCKLFLHAHRRCPTLHAAQKADKLRELRKAHSYTQDYVATALGVARQTYSHYETGKRTPDDETLYKLAGLYEISVDDLIQLTLSLDRNIYYDAPAPTQSGEIFDDFLKYLNSPENQKKYQHFTYLEKELLYYFNITSIS